MIVSFIAAISVAGVVQDPHWQLNASVASYGNHPLDGGVGTQTVDGYAFTVAAKPDGSLPFVEANVSSINTGRFILLKKLPDGKYSAYAIVHTNPYLPGKGVGLLLTPGEYLYHQAQSSQISIQSLGTMALISGRWANGQVQNGLWRVDATTFPTGFPITGGSTVTGYRFNVEARPDGKVPVIDWHTSEAETPATFELYRLNPASQTYDIHVKITDFPATNPGPLARLEPGDYAVRAVNNFTFWPHTRRFCTVVTGRLIDP